MIGDVLKRLRLIYGYKASEMSGILGISASYLSELENNKKQQVSLSLLERYATTFGIKLSSLFLISESFDDAEVSNKDNKFIRNMMMHLIEKTSKGLEEPDDTDKRIQ